MDHDDLARIALIMPFIGSNPPFMPLVGGKGGWRLAYLIAGPANHAIPIII